MRKFPAFKGEFETGPIVQGVGWSKTYKSCNYNPRRTTLDAEITVAANNLSHQRERRDFHTSYDRLSGAPSPSEAS